MQQRATPRSDYNVQWKVDFIWQPGITSPVVRLRRSAKALPKAKLAPIKRSRSLFNGLLQVWSTTAFWILAKPLHLRSMLSKSMRCTKTAMPAAGIGQQKGPTSSPWQSLTTCLTPMLQKLNELGCAVLPRSPFSPDLSSAYDHFFKHLDDFLWGKCFHNQQEAGNVLKEFIKSWSTNFYATRIRKHISHWQKCADCNGSYFD